MLRLSNSKRGYLLSISKNLYLYRVFIIRRKIGLSSTILNFMHHFYFQKSLTIFVFTSF